MLGFYTVYVWCLFLAALLGVGLALYAVKYKTTTVARPFIVIMLLAVWWALCASIVAVGPTVEWALFWGVPLRFVSVILTTPFLLIFTLIFAGREQWLTKRFFVLLFIIPLISIMFVLNYTKHNLFVYNNVYEQVGGYWLRTAWMKGAWFGLYAIYTYLLLALCLVLLVLYAWHAKYPYQQQSRLLLFGVSLPIVASVFTTFDLLPGPDLDLIILAFILMGLAFALALFNYRFLEIVPFARGEIVENMKDMVVVLDKRDFILDVNPVVETLLGYGRRQIIGRAATEVFAPWAKFFQPFTETQETNTIVPVFREDNPVYLDMSISPLKRRDQFVGRLFVFRDVTHLKETEAALQNALLSTEALVTVAQALNDFSSLTDLFQTVVDTIAVTLPADRVTLITLDLKEEMITDFVTGGKGADNVVNIPYTELMNGLSGWVVKEMVPALSYKDGPDDREDEQVRQRRYDSFCGAILVVPLVYHDRLQGTLTAINRPDEPDFGQRDVDLMQAMANQAAVAIENARLYEAEREHVKELQESNEALNAFSRMVAHDLKNPLGLIVGYTELINMREEETPGDLPEKSQKELQTISQQAYKMSAIIDSLLLLASIRRKQDVALTAVNMAIIVQNVLGRLAWQIEQKQAVVQLAESWPTAVGYAPWIEEIWANYISNALKYGGNPPHIELGTQPLANGYNCFWVRDNGDGLTSAQQAQLFKEFSRLAEHQTYEGHGLGLSIVEYIVRRVDGWAGVDSEPGAGSKFYFTLPSVK